MVIVVCVVKKCTPIYKKLALGYLFNLLVAFVTSGMLQNHSKRCPGRTLHGASNAFIEKTSRKHKNLTIKKVMNGLINLISGR